MTAGFQANRDFTDCKMALRWLFAKRPKRRATLVPIERIARALGDVHKHFDTVHIAGTNGKGSVAAKVARSLQLGGVRTGQFTSPHIREFGERIQINQRPICPKELLSHINHLRAICPQIEDLNFFEISFFIALLHFAKHTVEIAILETGVGGRLDATNICQPLVSAITTISLDHRQTLGDTLAEIAREKGGIVKCKTPLILGARAAHLGIEATASSRNAPLTLAGTPGQLPDSYNKAVARAVLKALECHIALPLDAVEGGLSYRLPCRFQIHRDFTSATINQPLALVLDVAHNPEGFQELARQIEREFQKAPLLVVVGLGADKDLLACLTALRVLPIQEVLPCGLPNAPCHTPDEICRVALHLGLACYSMPLAQDPKSAVLRAFELASAQSVVVICGSFYLMNEVQVALNETNGAL